MEKININPKDLYQEGLTIHEPDSIEDYSG